MVRLEKAAQQRKREPKRSSYIQPANTDLEQGCNNMVEQSRMLWRGDIQNQLAQLERSNLHRVQQQTLVSQIGRVQGNEHLGKLATAIKHGEGKSSCQPASDAAIDKPAIQRDDLDHPFQLRLPSLSLPDMSQPPGLLGEELHLDPEIVAQMEAMAWVQQQLDPARIKAALQLVNLSEIMASAPPNPFAVTPSTRSRAAPPRRPEDEPAEPRPGKPGDLLKAFTKLPEIDQFLDNYLAGLGRRVRGIYSGLGTGGQIATISGLIALGGGALIGILSSPRLRQSLLAPLRGQVIPVPGLNWLGVELYADQNQVMFGVHADLGGLLPEWLGFGSASSKAIGGTPEPESGPIRRSPVQRMLQTTQTTHHIQRQLEHAEALFRQAMAFYEQGEYRRAIIRFERVRQMPDLPDAIRRDCLYNIGRSNLRLSRFATAIMYFEQYLTLPGADVENGNANLQAAKQGAGVLADKGASDEPLSLEQVEAMFNEAMALYEQGEYRRAIIRFERIRQLPGAPEAVQRDCLYNIGQADLKLRRFATAIIYFERYLTMSGADVEAGNVQLNEAKAGAGIPVTDSTPEETGEVDQNPASSRARSGVPTAGQSDQEMAVAARISDQDIQYEIMAHSMGYRDTISQRENNLLAFWGYHQGWQGSINDQATGLFVGLLKPDPNSIKYKPNLRPVLVFRGTQFKSIIDFDLGDIVSDLNPSIGYDQFMINRDSIARLIEEAGEVVDMTGHSLGGALAQHAAVEFPSLIERIVTFQAPAIDSNRANQFSEQDERPSVTHHIATGDIVDTGGERHLTGEFYRHSPGKGLASHNSFLLTAPEFRERRKALGLLDDKNKEVLGIDTIENEEPIERFESYPHEIKKALAERGRSELSYLLYPVLAAVKALTRDDDSDIRQEIVSTPDTELAGQPVSQRSYMIRRLTRGITGDADEVSILQVLHASRLAGDVVEVVNVANTWQICYATDGDEYDQLRHFLNQHYYRQIDQDRALALIRRCMDGETAEWEEEMIADILVARKSDDGSEIISRIGRMYEGGGFNDGLNKVEWQLDGSDQDRVEALYGESI